MVFKAEPVPQVVVDDDNDTDDETCAARTERDERAKLDFQNVRVKQEPVDPGKLSCLLLTYRTCGTAWRPMTW